MRKNVLYRAEQALLSEMLYERRVLRKQTQAEVGKKVARPQTYISDVESGKRVVSFVEVLDLLKAYEEDPLSFLTEFEGRLTASSSNP